jgi:tetratricopeptide (TPR) repeat protein
VSIDRDVVLKQAETLLRRGELDGAIAAYLRLVDSEDVEGAFRGVDAVSDVALLEGDYDRAIEALQAFLIRVTHIPALVKLVAICAEAGRQDALEEAQAILAEAYLDAGRPRGLDSVARDATDDSRITLEVDVSELPALEPAVSPDFVDEPPPDLDDVFAQMRSRSSEDPETANAARVYERGLDHVLHGRIDEAIADLETAARAPLFRFSASAQLGRVYIERGQLKTAVEWLERAAEAPAPTPEDGLALLYDLADTLDRLGEPGRALAVLMELDADAGGYRDVRQRVERLARDQGRGPGA